MSHIVQADPGNDWRSETRQRGSLPERTRGAGLDALLAVETRDTHYR